MLFVWKWCSLLIGGVSKDRTDSAMPAEYKAAIPYCQIQISHTFIVKYLGYSENTSAEWFN